MKKKAIEKIPYLGVEKPSSKKEVRYLIAVAVKNVAHERHLFVEAYRNDKDSLIVPVARVVLAKNDFETYLPEKAEWTKQRIGTMYYSDGLLWETLEDKRETRVNSDKRSILENPEDLEKIKRFTKLNIWRDSSWSEYIEKYQDNVFYERKRAAEHRKYERRQKALDERKANTPELPEAYILEYADNTLFLNKHFLYYKKRGNWVDVACSYCGGVTEARWKAGQSYESTLQRRIEEPREGDYGICPLCGERGEWKCQGKVRGRYTKAAYIYLGQKYKKNGFVMRYIEVAKTWNLQEIAGEKGTEMFNACEEMSGIEIARTYYEKDRFQTDFHEHNDCTGRDFWDDCNLSGNYHIQLKDGAILAETYTNMAGTIFQYSGLREYMAAVPEENQGIVDKQERYLSNRISGQIKELDNMWRGSNQNKLNHMLEIIQDLKMCIKDLLEREE